MLQKGYYVKCDVKLSKVGLTLFLKWFGFGNGVVSGILQETEKKILAQPVTFLCSIEISAPNPSSGFPPL